MSSNPFDSDYLAPEPVASTVADEGFRADFELSGVKREQPLPAGFIKWDGKMITQPGAYRGISMSDYHHREICPGPSISSTGLKILAAEKGQRKKGQTPRHFWEGSTLNPKRRPRKDTDALRLGRAFHDSLLDPVAWDRDWHLLPEGFSRAAKVKMAAEIAEADAAIAAGLSCITSGEVERIEAMVVALRADPLIAPLITDGEAEVTLAWQDKETGVWLRARPDWMRYVRDVALNVKTDTDASWSGFSSSIAKFGYAQSAALELDGYKAVFGDAPRRFTHPVLEKPGEGWEPGDFIATALWDLPEEDIERGRWLNRIAINRFAECQQLGIWPGYTTEAEFCGLPSYARQVIDNGGAAEPADDEINGG